MNDEARGNEMRSATMADVLAVVHRSSRALVVVRLPETTIVAANAAAADLFGQSVTAVVGRHASSLVHGADEVRASVALSALAAGAIDSYCARRRLRSRAGALAWTCVRVLDVEGSPVALGMAVPGEQPRPLDAVEEELNTTTGIRWVSPPLPGEVIGVRGSTEASSAVTEGPYEVLDRLPRRKREIVAALLQGERVPTIAASMYLSASTVRSHLSAMYKAFGVRSQTELLSLLRSRNSSSGAAPTGR